MSEAEKKFLNSLPKEVKTLDDVTKIHQQLTQEYDALENKGIIAKFARLELQRTDVDVEQEYLTRPQHERKSHEFLYSTTSGSHFLHEHLSSLGNTFVHLGFEMFSCRNSEWYSTKCLHFLHLSRGFTLDILDAYHGKAVLKYCVIFAVR